MGRIRPSGRHTLISGFDTKHISRILPIILAMLHPFTQSNAKTLSGQ
jgi:hypothetical protein